MYNIYSLPFENPQPAMYGNVFNNVLVLILDKIGKHIG